MCCCFGRKVSAGKSISAAAAFSGRARRRRAPTGTRTPPPGRSAARRGGRRVRPCASGRAGPAAGRAPRRARGRVSRTSRRRPRTPAPSRRHSASPRGENANTASPRQRTRGGRTERPPRRRQHSIRQTRTNTRRRGRRRTRGTLRGSMRLPSRRGRTGAKLSDRRSPRRSVASPRQTPTKPPRPNADPRPGGGRSKRSKRSFEPRLPRPNRGRPCSCFRALRSPPTRTEAREGRAPPLARTRRSGSPNAPKQPRTRPTPRARRVRQKRICEPRRLPGLQPLRLRALVPPRPGVHACRVRRVGRLRRDEKRPRPRVDASGDFSNERDASVRADVILEEGRHRVELEVRRRAPRDGVREPIGRGTRPRHLRRAARGGVERRAERRRRRRRGRAILQAALEALSSFKEPRRLPRSASLLTTSRTHATLALIGAGAGSAGS